MDKTKVIPLKVHSIKQETNLNKQIQEAAELLMELLVKKVRNENGKDST